MPRLLLLVLTITAGMLTGCQRPMYNGQAANSNFGQNPFYGVRGDVQRTADGQVIYGSQQNAIELAELTEKVNDLNGRLGRFDADNQGLTAQVAGLKQRLDTANNYNFELKERLRETVSQLQIAQQTETQLRQQMASIETQVAAAQASTSTSQQPFKLAGAATIRANNSLMGKLDFLKSSGASARMDGDVIRVEFSSDRLFVPGSYQIQQTESILLNNLASTIRQHFPEQFIGIEAHWDNSPIDGSVATHHQLTATQALAVFNHMIQTGIPAQQMFTVGMANSRPRYNGSQNRRIEIVIYPESYQIKSQ